MKILLIDDEAFMLKLLAHQLAKLGFTQTQACDGGQAALALLATGAPVDLIFCDLQMPGMDGVEFIRHLVQRVGYQGALVLVSGEDQRILQSAERLAQAHRLNVLGVLAKPVAPEQLRRVLDAFGAGAAAAPRGADKTYGASELRRAIEEGELVNYYQPKVAVASGAVAGVETLVRWRHPRDGLVQPDQFIATAEQHGLIDALTRGVLDGALRQARLWRDAGLHLHVAVNVSMDNLGAVGFPDLVTEAAARAGVPLTDLVLELTESRLMTDRLAPLDILTRLRLKRIGLSIDDFGTGHSSLAQLRDIPFDELKIDRGFIHGAGADPSLKAIVGASCALARQLGMKIVAEGVEDRADWDFVRGAGCDLAQGYFIAEPMPGAALAGWVADWEARRGALAEMAS